MISRAFAAQVRGMWQQLQPEFEDKLRIVTTALIDADTIETVRLLQGRAKAYREILNLPERLDQLVDQET